MTNTNAKDQSSFGAYLHTLLNTLLGGALCAAGGLSPAFAAEPSGWRGYLQFEGAYTYENPEHWSKLRGRVELGRQGAFGEGLKYKIAARADYDLAYSLENDFYPPDVRERQRRGFEWREVYVDGAVGDLEFRVGRQHIVWGEMVGLFFADVVSARDLREFFLPQFDSLRIPQWAVRGEYFVGDLHLEAVWVPLPSFDKVARPGADFYNGPAPTPGFNFVLADAGKPTRKLDNSNFGLRAGWLTHGWDLAAFAYRSLDVNPVYARQLVPTAPAPTLLYTPEHDRINQWGGTLTKDFGGFVLKAEAVMTRGRRVQVLNPLNATGLAPQNMVDYAIGADIPLEDDWRINVQYFERVHLDAMSDLAAKKHEPGWTLLVNKKWGELWEAELIAVQSLSRHDFMLRPRLDWNFARNWRARFGADVFGGRRDGLFGRYGDSDRLYTEIRYSF